MFGKIKGKLSNVFSKSEDEIFDEDEIVEDTSDQEINGQSKTSSDNIQEDENLDEESKEEDSEEEPKEKKGFFSRVFGKKDKEEQDEEELQELEEDMLEDVPQEEKEAIIEHKEIPEEIVKERKKEVDKAIEKEEKVEKEEIKKVKEEKKESKKEKVIEEELIQENFEEEKKEEVEEKEDLNQGETEEKKGGAVTIEDASALSDKSEGFFSKTFGKLTSKKISEDDFSKIWLELEIFLLEINIAFEIVQKIEEKLREVIIEEKFNRFSLSQKIREVMIEEVKQVMVSREANLLEEINKINENGEIARIVVLGVNGTGKTTTIAKFVKYLQDNDKSLVVAAADTFRAAAVEQLDEHSKKVGFKLIQHKGGSDPAAVAYDAIEHAKAKKLDVVIVDTAGRMPNNSNLMQELAKIERVTKADINLFVGDSISGNDLVEQIELFDKVVGINGMILTKTDTDERPGSVVTAAFTIDKPIYYLGIGQGYDDLIKFDAQIVAEKLFEVDDEE